jgi:hypothetical protein
MFSMHIIGPGNVLLKTQFWRRSVLRGNVHPDIKSRDVENSKYAPKSTQIAQNCSLTKRAPKSSVSRLKKKNSTMIMPQPGCLSQPEPVFVYHALP